VLEVFGLMGLGLRHVLSLWRHVNNITWCELQVFISPEVLWAILALALSVNRDIGPPTCSQRERELELLQLPSVFVSLSLGVGDLDNGLQELGRRHENRSPRIQ